MMRINDNTENKGLGNVAYLKLANSKKNETIEIIFTKGKVEIIMDDVDRINVYENSMNIYFKDKTSKFINLHNVTYME